MGLFMGAIQCINYLCIYFPRQDLKMVILVWLQNYNTFGTKLKEPFFKIDSPEWLRKGI